MRLNSTFNFLDVIPVAYVHKIGQVSEREIFEYLKDSKVIGMLIYIVTSPRYQPSIKEVPGIASAGSCYLIICFDQFRAKMALQPLQLVKKRTAWKFI